MKIEQKKFYEWCGSRILRKTVIPSKRRVIRNEDVLIPTDLREWITPEDSQEIREVIEKLNLPSDKVEGTFDDRARSVWKYVIENIRYVSDATAQRKQDFWQFPAETLALGTGDCEDCSFLLASLLLAAGISSFCVRVVIGVLSQEDGTSSLHSWPVYRDEDGQWRILESTLSALPDKWPLADDLARPDTFPQYFPDICLNQHHVWTIGHRRIQNVYSFLSRKRRNLRPGKMLK